MEALSDPIVGIDLGTSNSVVAHADASGAVQVLSDDGGAKIHPSVVSFHPGGGVVVGAAAKQRKVIDPQNTIYSVKRLIGRSYRSPEVQTAKARTPYQIKEGASQMPMIATRGGEFAVPEISAIVLDHVRNIAAARLGTEVSRAVVTVPASFNDAQRSATATAGAIAGLTVVRVLNEPTAAALAYGHAKQLSDVIAVYDFGGGTFDISILKLDDQVYEVLGTAGDSFLGGDDLDERLVDKMVSKFLAENRIDLRTNEVSMMRLRAVAEQTKIELSRRARAVVRVDEIAYGPRGAPLTLQIEISREEFVKEVADLVDRTFPVCREAMQLAGVTSDRVNDIVLVGGTTKIPYVREQVGKFFQRAPRADISAEDAVAVGAALQGASLERILAKPRGGSRPLRSLGSDETAQTDAISAGEGHGDGDESTGATTETLELEPSGGIATPTAELISPGEDRERHTTAGSFQARLPSEPTITKPDTSYSEPRRGKRDTYEPRRAASTTGTTGLTPGPDSGLGPGLFDELTPPPQAQPIARITRPTGTEPGTAAPPTIPPLAPAATLGAKTLFGVPQGPPPIPPARTSGAASSTLDIPTLHPSGTAAGIGLATQPGLPATRPPNPISWGDADGVARPPPPPQSPTAPLGDLSEPAPASTARGFQPPPAPSAPSAPTLMVAPPAIAAAIPQAPARPPIVLEVTPRGLGIGTVAGFCEELIRRNSRLPSSMKKLFTTSRDRQDTVRILVCQGESRRIEQNVVIGDLVLAGLPPRPRGETSIEVTFSLDASGILQVHARDALTGTEQRAELDLVGGMQQQDVAASRDRLQLLRR